MKWSGWRWLMTTASSVLGSIVAAAAGSEPWPRSSRIAGRAGPDEVGRARRARAVGVGGSGAEDERGVEWRTGHGTREGVRLAAAARCRGGPPCDRPSAARRCGRLVGVGRRGRAASSAGLPASARRSASGAAVVPAARRRSAASPPSPPVPAPVRRRRRAVARPPAPFPRRRRRRCRGPGRRPAPFRRPDPLDRPPAL